MSLTKEAICKIEDMAKEPEEIKIDGRSYTTKAVHKVEKPSIKEPIRVRTLCGIIDYIESNLDVLDLEKIAIHIASPTCVKIISQIEDEWRQREFYVEANFKNSGHPFGVDLDREKFIVSLLSNFEDTKDRNELFEAVTKIKKDDSEITNDDGISQTVTLKSGAALLSEKNIKNPIALRPYRTFTEVDGQPEGSYVFRLTDDNRHGITLTLHDSNGDDWEVKAINKIKEFLQSKLKEIETNIIILG